jgi:thiol-disulfide isomerase/thioredoxin
MRISTLHLAIRNVLHRMAVGALVLVFVACSACATDDKAANPSTTHGGNPFVGKPMSLVNLVDLRTGRVFDAQVTAGKVVLVDFWASWCAPCKESFPFYDGLAKELGPQGFVVVAVGVDEDQATAARFLDEAKVSFPAVWDRGHRLVGAYNVDVMPSAFILDGTGVIRVIHEGFVKDDEATIRAAVAQQL